MSEEKTLKARVVHKHKTEAEWRLDVYDGDTLREDAFIPKNGELIIFDEDEIHLHRRFKFGNGVDNVIDLPFSISAPIWEGIGENSLQQDGCNAIGANGVAFGEKTYAGVKGYYIKAVERYDNGDQYGDIYRYIFYLNTEATITNTPTQPTIEATYNPSPGSIYYDDTATIDWSDFKNVYINTNSNWVIFEVSSIQGNAVVTEEVRSQFVFEPLSDEGNKKAYTIFCREDPTIGIVEIFGDTSTSIGKETITVGDRSYSEGFKTLALKDDCHSEGYETTSIHNHSHAEGRETIASGAASHAEGYLTSSYGNHSHAEGYGSQTGDEISKNTSVGQNAHAEGYYTKASGNQSHAEGYTSIASGSAAHAEGGVAQAKGSYSHAEGYGTIAEGSKAHAEGDGTQALHEASHAGGFHTITGRKNQTVIGEWNRPNTNALFVIGGGTEDLPKNLFVVDVDGAHDGSGNYYAKMSDIPEIPEMPKTYWEQKENLLYNKNKGNDNIDIGKNTTIKKGTGSFLQGAGNTVNESYSMATGEGTTASGLASHSEGHSTVASGARSHAEGAGTQSIGPNSHAEGHYSHSKGSHSHAEGKSTQATGQYAHSEGELTIASGRASHSAGYYTRAKADYQSVCGKFNADDSDALFIVGNGTADNARNNAFVVKNNGALVNKDINNIKDDIKDNTERISTLEGLLLDYLEDKTKAYQKNVPDNVGPIAVLNKIYGGTVRKHNPSSTNILDPQIIFDAIQTQEDIDISSNGINLNGSINMQTSGNIEMDIPLNLPAGNYSIGYSSDWNSYISIQFDNYQNSITSNGTVYVLINIRGIDLINDTEGGANFNANVCIWINNSETIQDYQNYYANNMPVQVNQINSYATKSNAIENSSLRLGEYTTQIDSNTYRFQGSFSDDNFVGRILIFEGIPKGKYYMEVKTIAGTEPDFFGSLNFYFDDTGGYGHGYQKNTDWEVKGDEDFSFTTEQGYMANDMYLTGNYDWTFSMILKPLEPIYTYTISDDMIQFINSDSIIYGVDGNYIDFDKKMFKANKKWDEKTDTIRYIDNKEIDISSYLFYPDYLSLPVCPGGSVEFKNTEQAAVSSTISYLIKKS